MTYLGDGDCDINITSKPNRKAYQHRGKYKKFGMIAGGTGITPFYQVSHFNNYNHIAY